MNKTAWSFRAQRRPTRAQWRNSPVCAVFRPEQPPFSLTGFAVGGNFPYPPPAMDYRIQKPQTRCATSDRPLAGGEPFYSVLAREDGKVVRVDIAPDAWQGPPENCLAWWRSTVPNDDARPTLAPVDVLLDLLEQLAGIPEDAALRYLLALVLVRRRVLKIVDPTEDQPEPADSSVLFVSCRRRDTSYTVSVVSQDPSQDESLERRLNDLLWTGEAA